MTVYHAQATWTVRQTDVPKDYVVNNTYWEAGAAIDSSAGNDLAQALANTLASAVGFGGPNPWDIFSGRDLVVKCYDMAAPKPRPIVGVFHHIPTTWETAALAPRHVALCLSYYADRNIPRQRGRIYLGPFKLSDMAEVPSVQFLNKFQDLAKGLETMDTRTTHGWTQQTWSTVTNTNHDVTNWWCNDKWDVQHSRQHVELTRVKWP
jgi:hypothetical protein